MWLFCNVNVKLTIQIYINYNKAADELHADILISTEYVRIVCFAYKGNSELGFLKILAV